LKKSQYDELLSKMWKKDPTNPVNVNALKNGK